MQNIDSEVENVLNGLIVALKSKNVESISATKLLLLINKKYRMELDQNGLEEILSKSPIVSEVNGDQIILQGKKSEDDKESSEEVEDTAKKQAYDNLTSESVNFDKLINKSFKLKHLDESMEDYHLLNAIKKNDRNLIITEAFRDGKSIKLRCKVEDSPLTVVIDSNNL